MKKPAPGWSKLAYLIPVVYIIAFALFWVAVEYTIIKETQGASQVKEVLYGMLFFFANPAFSYILLFFLVIPFVMLIGAFFKKRKDIILGSLICALISVTLLVVAVVFH
ncbi:MAG: hypothetical protein ACNA8K_01480 [Cyclonatronaceae bacterium]